jgi:hypothetical protein
MMGSRIQYVEMGCCGITHPVCENMLFELYLLPMYCYTISKEKERKEFKKKVFGVPS